MRKLSFVAFREAVRLPNVKQQGAVNAAPGTTDVAGFNIDYDEEYRFVRIESRRPRNKALDMPVWVPLENVKFFNLEEDVPKTEKPQAPKP